MAVSSRRPIIAIVGPTAGGKTDLAIALASRLPGGGECIGADSMQVYRGMDIGTAKPTPEQRRQVTHHLLDIVDPDEGGFSVDRWLELAESTIAEVRGRGRWPIVVGGTNLYMQALLKGLDGGPPPDAALRARLAESDTAELRDQLERIDPASAERIHPNDRKRTIRAIEVYRSTGQTISSMQSSWPAPGGRPDAILVGLELPVETVNRRINQRVRGMVAGGLVEETRTLLRDGRLGLQAREALGYKQILEHLEGRLSLEEAVEQVKIRTRRYAKQQRTWLRRFHATPGALWLSADEKCTQTVCENALIAIMGHPATQPGPPMPPGGPREKKVDRSAGVD